MKLVLDEEILIRSLKDNKSVNGFITKIDEDIGEFRLDDSLNLNEGDNVAVEAEGKNTLYGDVVKVDKNSVTIKWTWEKSRKFFRVDDILQVSCKKINKNPLPPSRIFLGSETYCSVDFEINDLNSNSNIIKLLKSIDSKLSIIMDMLKFEQEGFNKIDYQQVNLSASGIRFFTNEDINIGDVVEVKFVLPKNPPLGIVACGKVVKAECKEDGYEIAVHFLELGDDICDEIVQYTLKKQREIIMRNRSKLYE